MDKQNEKNNFLNSKSLIQDKNNNFVNWLKSNMIKSIAKDLPIDPSGIADKGKEISIITGSDYRPPSNNVNAYKQSLNEAQNKDQNILKYLVDLSGIVIKPKEFYSKESMVPEGFDADSIKINNIDKGLFKRKVNYTITGKDNYKPQDPNKQEKINEEQALGVIPAIGQGSLPNNDSIPILNQESLSGGFNWNDSDVKKNYFQEANINNTQYENSYGNNGFDNYIENSKSLSKFIPSNISQLVYSEGGSFEEPDPTLPPSPNVNAKGRYLKGHVETVIYPRQVVKYNEDNKDGILMNEINPSEDYTYTDENGVIHTITNEFKNKGKINTTAFLKNNASVSFDGTIDDHKKMLKKVNRSNWTGAHGFRGQGWKNGMSKEEIEQFKKENPFFERGRKRELIYFLNNSNPVKRVYYKNVKKEKMAEGGTFFPNDGFPFMEYFNQNDPELSQISTTHGSMNFTEGLNDFIAERTGTEKIQNEPIPRRGFQQKDNEIDTYNGDIELKRKFDKENIRLAAQASVGVLNALGNRKESNRKEAELKKEFSDPFNYYGTHGTDRGDYMFNTPGAGPNFRPNEYIRSGFGTKNASLGLEVGDELELNDSEIEELRKQGYDIEYLD